ncbi:GNAT family N-acetyltransferase [Microvirgula aerodenitrificans]|uniref:GNAT family N-acetyltransferase n=1 Tax=Microvirgula aerodenitrificans TaxID=57480 RepID=UPI001F1EB741|nr:GNAT family N-acetyltransferase [Microvirgula aerodenitrificans]
MADTGAGMRVRHAVRADLPGIVDIYNSTVPSRQVTADTEPVTVASREPWFDAHSPARYPLWVLEDAAGVMLGWISLSAFYGRPAYAATAEVSIYLAESARGRGLGRLALDYALEACPALGIRTLLGFIFAHNTPAWRCSSAGASVPGVTFPMWRNSMVSAVRSSSSGWRCRSPNLSQTS